MRCWEDWKRRGARLVIVTASPELLVAPFGRALGAEIVIGTRLATDAEGRITGDFDGANCRGAEKVARLEAVFGAGVRLQGAYGDTAGDREMLGHRGKPRLPRLHRPPDGGLAAPAGSDPISPLRSPLRSRRGSRRRGR